MNLLISGVILLLTATVHCQDITTEALAMESTLAPKLRSHLDEHVDHPVDGEGDEDHSHPIQKPRLGASHEYAAPGSEARTEAVKCSQCNSAPDRDGKECESNPNKFSTDCTNDIPQGSKYTGCWKIDQHVDWSMDIDGHEMKKHHRIIRSCGYSGVPGKCYYKAGLGGRQNVCFCTGTDCNSAHSFGNTFLATIISTVLSALFVSYTFKF
jgi:hypothetical protein